MPNALACPRHPAFSLFCASLLSSTDLKVKRRKVLLIKNASGKTKLPYNMFSPATCGAQMPSSDLWPCTQVDTDAHACLEQPSSSSWLARSWFSCAVLMGLLLQGRVSPHSPPRAGLATEMWGPGTLTLLPPSLEGGS